MHLFKLQKIPRGIQEYKLATNVINFLSGLAEAVQWVVRFNGDDPHVFLQIDQNIPADIKGFPLLEEIEKYIWSMSSPEWLDWILTVPMRKIVYQQEDIPLIYVQRTLPWLAQQIFPKTEFRLTEQGLFTRAEYPGDMYMNWQKIASQMAYLYSRNALYDVPENFARQWQLRRDPIKPLWYPHWGDVCPLTFGIRQNYGSVVDFLLTRDGIDQVYWYGQILHNIHTRDDLIREVRKIMLT